MVDLNFQHDYQIKWSWTKISEITLKILVHLNMRTVQGQNFQRGTKIFSTIFEKNGPGPRFSGKIAENFGPQTKILGTKIPVTDPQSVIKMADRVGSYIVVAPDFSLELSILSKFGSICLRK